VAGFREGIAHFDFLASKGWPLKTRNGKRWDGLAERSDRAGALIDSTNPKPASWYWDGFGTLAATGFDWFWLDETEPISCGRLFLQHRFGDRYHNVFPFLHTQGVAEAHVAIRANKRNLILRVPHTSARSATGASSVLGYHPTWEALQRQSPLA